MTDYVKGRLKNQIDWYSNRATLNKRFWHGSKAVTILLSAFIIYSGYVAVGWSSKWVGLMGILIMLSEGTQALGKFHEKWMNYRTTSESLKHQKSLFEQRAGSYDKISETAAVKLLTEKCETLISRENSQWVEVLKNK